MHLTMEDWTHKPHRQGLFSSNAIAKIFNSWRDQRVSKAELLSWDNPARTSSGSVLELWISDGLEWFFAVNFLYPNFAVLARSKQLILMPVTVKFRSDFLVCGLQGHLLWHLAKVGPMFPCHKDHESMKNCRDWAISHTGLEVGLRAFQLPMFVKCNALPKGFVQHDGHVCQRISMLFVKI